MPIIPARRYHGPSCAGPLDRGNGLFTDILGNQSTCSGSIFFSQLLST